MKYATRVATITEAAVSMGVLHSIDNAAEAAALGIASASPSHLVPDVHSSARDLIWRAWHIVPRWRAAAV